MTDLAESTETISDVSDLKKSASINTFERMGRFVLLRLVSLFLTVAIGVYLTILIANMGGYVDEIRKGAIREVIGQQVTADPEMRRLSVIERNEVIAELIRIEEQRQGMDRPFVLRSLTYLRNALLLDLGRSQNMTSDSGSKLVRLIIVERLPSTLVLFATANLFLFFSALFSALYLSRRYGSVADRLVVLLTPTSAAPGWFYGIFLILIFAAALRWLPFGGMVSAPPPDNRLDYALSVMRHMILPTMAILISSVFVSIYTWRTFFLIFSSEDYVEVAKAKGLPSNLIERRYILRPTLPNIITNFMLLIIGLWYGAIILETVFTWPGIGRLFFMAIGQFDTPVIVGITVIYAYLLGVTVFLLDFIYALVDPRVKVGGAGGHRA
jgi:peptide/nickel transport system permease protein